MVGDLWASHTNVLLTLPAPPLPRLTLSHRHAPRLFKSSFHGDSILKFSRSRTRIIFYLLLLLRGNLGKGSLLQIKRGVRGEEGRCSFLSSLDWIRWSCWNSSVPASPTPSPHHHSLGSLVTCSSPASASVKRWVKEGKVRKEEIKEKEREKGWADICPTVSMHTLRVVTENFH